MWARSVSSSRVAIGRAGVFLSGKEGAGSFDGGSAPAWLLWATQNAGWTRMEPQQYARKLQAQGKAVKGRHLSGEGRRQHSARISRSGKQPLLGWWIGMESYVLSKVGHSTCVKKWSSSSASFSLRLSDTHIYTHTQSKIHYILLSCTTIRIHKLI